MEKRLFMEYIHYIETVYKIYIEYIHLKNTQKGLYRE